MIDIRLEGGEFDGTKDVIDNDRPPNQVGAFKCPECGGVHVRPYLKIKDLEGILSIVRYIFVRTDDFGALYRFGDSINSGPSGPSIGEPIKRERRELIPA